MAVDNVPPSKFGAATKFLNLKKSFDDAVRQNDWKMEHEAMQQRGEQANTRIGTAAHMAENSNMTGDQLNQYQQSGKYPSDFTATNQSQQNKEVALSEKKDQFNQRQWTIFINKNTPSLASSRSTLGMAANGNLRADRALSTVQNNSVMTYQDLGNVVGDLAGIYQGGAPTDMGMKHQQYETIQAKIANIKQYMTGKPQDAVPPAIKQKIMEVIQSLKSVNNEAIKNHLNSQEKAQKNLIANFPDQWSEFRQQVEQNYMGSNNAGNSDDPEWQKFQEIMGSP